jgi:anti-sigma B factor antagonist
MANLRDFAVDVETNVPGGESRGTVVRVMGELDLASSSQFEQVLQSTDLEGRVVVDLTECDFIDSSGLRVLLAGAMRAESEGGRLVLVAPEPNIRRVLELTGVESKLPVHETREAAFAS